MDESGYYWRRVGTSLAHLIITEGALRGAPHYLRNLLEAVDAGKHPAACDMKISWGLTTQSATLLGSLASAPTRLLTSKH